MIELSLPHNPREPLSILCLGAHSDDLEIGCGATVLQLSRRYPRARFHWVVFGPDDQARRREAAASAAAFLEQVGEKQVIVDGFRDGFFPFAGERIKERFEEIKAGCRPDVIFTHYRSDLHQDHRAISDFTWQTFRDALILEYEIPKWDGDLGTPSCYVAVSPEVADRKVELLLEHFKTQRDKHWFTADTFRALMRLRGVESNTAYAEAFHARKLVIG